MQNWDTMQSTSNYVEHNNWYNNVFAANIKTEPGISSLPGERQQNSPAPSTASSSNHMENILKQQHQHFSAMDTNMTALTPSPTKHNNNNHHHVASSKSDQQQQYFDTAGMNQQLMQQQQYQQHFQQAQQAAAQNQVTSHLSLGFNPLTPPGLPQAVIPTMSHYFIQSKQRNQQKTPSPLTIVETSEKSTLTPQLTPPMDITPPKSPKSAKPPNPVNISNNQQDQELMSNSSEDLKYTADSDEDETICLPIFNSHGKMKNYKCKFCGKVVITKLKFWEHVKTHMKPEKILQCNRCPFATELKHHLEYHTRKHKNLKPFQCDKCSYTCVNKSMLNSHRKSHSSVYQYRCSDCDYATKYCHSFKLHLRKYDHKPGIILDEEGIPNPSVVIDVYGTRRGPKNKGSSGNNLKKSHANLKMPTTSQLSAALQGFPLNTKSQMPVSPAKSSSSVASELPALTINMSLQQQQQNAVSQMSPSHLPQASSQNGDISNLLPPLASLLQQNRNIAFFPYWNFNLQMLAAQQQAAVLAQMSPRMREQLLKHDDQNSELHLIKENNSLAEKNDEEEEEQELDRKSVDSAMDLSQGTPTKDEKQHHQTPPDLIINLKLAEDNNETPVFPSATASRRKGRVLKLDPEQLAKANQLTSAPTSPQAISGPEMLTSSSPIAASSVPANTGGDHSLADESMETNQNNHNKNNPSNTSSTSTASSSGNSSNSSSTGTSCIASTTNPSPSATPTMYECKYCDIFFKHTVLYTIHMGYHSCDDAFKCNMCGEKCDGPIGLCVHIARNAHS